VQLANGTISFKFPMLLSQHNGCCVLKAGDWLQGPYVYALYEAYNMSKHDIEVLFVAGFGSSMIVGTVVGSFADK
jgi:Sugar-tranasporters, 12 TM